MEFQVQLPLDLLQRRPLLRRLQTPDPVGDESEMQLWYGCSFRPPISVPSRTDSLSPHRINPQRTLGSPLLDQQRSL